MKKNLIKTFLVVFISTIIGYIVRWIIGKLDLEYNFVINDHTGNNHVVINYFMGIEI